MQYGNENISTIVTNVLHVGQKHFLDKLQTSKIWDTMCPNFRSAFWDFHATFMDKSKVYYREDNGGYSQAWVV
jgi:hypothetical protein